MRPWRWSLGPRTRPAWLLAALLLVASGTVAAPAAAEGWRHLYTKDGIRVEARDVPGRDLPQLRGIGILHANLYHVLAILDDVPHHHTWVPRLHTSAVLRRPSPMELWMYVRFDFPWPTTDRDSVIHVEVSRTLAPVHEVVLRSTRSTDASRPPRDDAVRVPRSLAEARMRWLGPDRTHLTYLVDIDPGGSLPRWLVRMLSEDLPLDTLRGIKRRLQATRGRYDAFLSRWDPSLQPPPAPPAAAAPHAAPGTP